MNVLSREDAAWVGGLFEGEGCWVVHYRKNRKPNGYAQLAMTDRDTVDRLASIVGGGAITVKPKQAGRKTAFSWQLHGFEALQAFVAMIWPFLGQRRKARAKEMLAIVSAQRVRRRRCPHVGLQRTASGDCSACKTESAARISKGERVYSGKRGTPARPILASY